jgi:phytanoyl-CoA hydroxylase
MSQMGDLAKDGFVLIKNPFPSNYLSSLRDWLDVQLVALSNSKFYSPHFEYGLKDKPEFGVLYDVWQRYPIVRKLASHKSIYEALMPVLGDDIYLYENSFLFKTPSTLDYVPWHQDFMNRTDESLKYIAFISVDYLRHDQGALKVIPSSHLNGFYPYRVKQGQAHHTGIPEAYYDKLNVNTSIYIDQDPGDVLIFNQLLVHSLDKISSTCDSMCRSFRFSYQGFEQMFVPRHTPISIFGGDPVSVINRSYQPHLKSIRKSSSFLSYLRKLQSKFRFY